MALKLSPLLSEIAFRSSHGPKHFWNWLSDRALDRRRDAEFGIDTWRRYGQRDLGLSEANSFGHQAVSYPDMRELIGRLKPSAGDVFLDLGAGMGRAVCVAATFRFRKVLGVEISPQLCTIAEKNVRRIEAKLVCRNVRIEQASAEKYCVPLDVTVVYLFNPFQGTVLRTVLENIRRSLSEAPRPMRLVFCGTVSTRAFAEQARQCGWLNLEDELVLPTGAVALVYSAKQQVEQ